MAFKWKMLVSKIQMGFHNHSPTPTLLMLGACITGHKGYTQETLTYNITKPFEIDFRFFAIDGML